MFKNLKWRFYNALFWYKCFWCDRSLAEARRYQTKACHYTNKANRLLQEESNIFNKLREIEES